MHPHLPTEHTKTQKVSSFFKSIKPHRPFLVFLLLWTIFLSWNITRTHQWSAWINGDAQCMLTLRYWIRDPAISKHALLFLSQGYTPWIQLFDGTSLDDHAMSSAYTYQGTLIKRAYYNHYPTFYLVPLAIIANALQNNSLFFFQCIQLIISSFGVLFLYFFLYTLFRSRVASVFGALSYALSGLYVDWAHSLANMPIDDFFRNGFLLLSILEKKYQRKVFHIGLWLSYFALALTSLDSIVFCFIWLVGLDLIHIRQLRIKRWIVFGFAPVLARLIQFMQSLSIFGWNGSIADWFGRWNTMANQDGNARLLEHLLSISREIRYLLGFGYDKHHIIQLHLLVIFFALCITAGLFILFKEEQKNTQSPWSRMTLYVALLFFSGMGFGFIFPGASWMYYEGRQFIPFFSALIAYLFCVNWNSGKKSIRIKMALALLVVPTLFTVTHQYIRAAQSFEQGHPAYAFGMPEPELVQFGKQLRAHIQDDHPMIFLFDPDETLITWYPHPQDTRRETYAMSPQLLYEADTHVMAFKTADALLRDIDLIRTQTDNAVQIYIVSKPIHTPTLLEKIQTIQLQAIGEPDKITNEWLGQRLQISEPSMNDATAE